MNKKKKAMMLMITTLLLIGSFFPIIQSADFYPASIDIESVNKTYEIKEWTSLYYLNVETNDPWWNILINADILHDHFMYKKQLKSGGNHHVLVLQDRRRSPAVIYYMDETCNRTVLKEIGEVNTGDPETLIDFINYGKEHYPAERYHLAFWSHSNAWFEICADASSNHDRLTSDELHYALTETQGVDILSFIGCCLMSSLEVIYEVKDCCNVYVASESTGNQNDWYGMIDDLCDILNNNSTMSSVEIGERIVDLICSNPNDFRESLTISAIRTDKINMLVEHIDALCNYLLENDDSLFENFISARNQTKDFFFFDNSHFLNRFLGKYGYLLDLYDFVENYLEIETDQNISQILKAIKENLTEIIIADCHGKSQTGSHGLSIFYSSNDLISTYTEYNLYFTKSTHWDELLNNHKEKSKRFNNQISCNIFLENHLLLFSILRDMINR